MPETITTDNCEMENTPKKRGRKPSVKKGYFLQEQEDAFRKYLESENLAEKNQIFEKQIYPALCKMVECLIRRYCLFSVDETYEDTFNDALSFLITKISNFNPDKNCKAYSYCGTVCKNYLILKRTQSIKKRDKFGMWNNNYDDKYTNDEPDDNSFHINLIEQTLSQIKSLLEEKKTEKRPLTENEIKIGQALVEILSHWDDMIDDSKSRKFNKMSLLYFIKEYTLCTTAEVRNAMKLYKNLYLFTKQNFLNNGEN